MEFVKKAFNTAVLQKSRLAWVDYLKGIAILLVVYRHALLGIQNSGVYVPPGLVTANMIFFSFRMPLFFILSGIFISGSLGKRTTGQLIYTKFENLLYPYFIWSIIEISLQIPFSHYTNTDKSWIDYTYILYQPRKIDHLWYLPALFNTTVIYLLVKTKLKAKPWMQLLGGLALFFLAPLVDNISMLSDWMSFYVFFALGDAISVFFFKESTQRFLRNNWALLLVAILFAYSQYYYLSHNVGNNSVPFLLIALTGCCAMTVLAFHLQRWNVLTFLRVLGYHSLYIYVMHVLVVATVRIILKNVFHIHDPYVLLFTAIFLGVTLPVIFYNLFIFEKPLWFLFALKKYKQKRSSPDTPATATVPAASPAS